MSKLRLAFRVVLFVSATLTLASVAQALPTRTWVSGVGDDLYPCSRTAPCKTFAGAIVKTEAGGEINCLDSGGFGAVIIRKSITIDGTGVLAGIAAPGATGIRIQIPDGRDSARTVRLRGLSINGLGSNKNGIDIDSASRVSIEDSVIDGFAHGIYVAASPGKVFVRNTTIRNNTIAGIKASAAGQVGINDVSLVFNERALAGGAAIVSFNNIVMYGNNN